MASIPGLVYFNMLEIALGAEGNTKTLIRTVPGGTPVREQTTHGILDCNGAITFWITWRDSRLEAFIKFLIE